MAVVVLMCQPLTLLPEAAQSRRRAEGSRESIFVDTLATTMNQIKVTLKIILL